MTGAPTPRQVEDLVCEFQLAFDQHDWDGLVACLADPLEVDYSGLRNEPPRRLAAAEYASARRDALDHLHLQHNHTNLRVSTQPVVTAACNFQIYRFSREDDRHFHSWGRYRFEVASVDGRLVLGRIHQELLINDGDPSLHRGVRSDGKR